MDKSTKRSGTRIYNIWNGMIGRCTHESYPSYKNYGAKGISVCEAWQSFETFYEWAMANGYADNLTLDRQNNSGNYEPSNCKWSTMKEQQNNRKDNRVISFDGKTKTISQWAEETGINTHTLFTRFKRGWDVKRALTTSVGGQKL